MLTVADWVHHLEAFAPPTLAASWDNVGLLLGERKSVCECVMTCLTITPEVVAETVAETVQLIVSHHPILFKGAKSLADTTPEGRLLLPLLRAGTAVYSPHTAFDNCPGGINDGLATRFGLLNVRPLRPIQADLAGTGGEGRIGVLATPLSLQEFAARVKRVCQAPAVQFVGDSTKPVRMVALACGAAGVYLPDAIRANADVFVTGEARFHDLLAAEAAGISLVLPGHYATERPGIEELAVRLQSAFPTARVWASRAERDPLSTI